MIVVIAKDLKAVVLRFEFSQGAFILPNTIRAYLSRRTRKPAELTAVMHACAAAE